MYGNLRGMQLKDYVTSVRTRFHTERMEEKKKKFTEHAEKLKEEAKKLKEARLKALAGEESDSDEDDDLFSKGGKSERT